ncbi:MAG TPA: NAD(P)H-hydrate dehydratase [Acidimicrobiales bacterium]|nr:NAD(P)H-hydrate dehydratase [Acidimicrobiales bacterium]
MQPLLTAAEMAAADERARAEVGLETLVERAGRAVATEAIGLLGGAYGRRVVVLAGRGHNGDDGRVAAAWLRRRGAQVLVVPLAEAPAQLPACDLVVDAALGTGFRGTFDAPAAPPGAAVLAVDLPSGVAADTGEACGRPLRADLTCTLAALKPGLVLGEGRALAGRVRLHRIGIDVGTPAQHLVGDEDLAWLPARGLESHKWQSALYLLAGSPAMAGAAALAASGAARAGSGMVRVGTPGSLGPAPVAEAVARPLPAEGFASDVLAELGRCRVLVAGPGLGTAPATRAELREVLRGASLPLVLDADALNLLGTAEEAAELLAAAGDPARAVLTPHDGEYARLEGAPPGPDRLAAARRLARRTGAVVLVKGSTTVVAHPLGEALVVTAGSARLATAGTGDVLAGMIGAFVARGLPPLRAAALAAHVHGRAASAGLAEGLVASDLPALVAAHLSGRGGG